MRKILTTAVMLVLVVCVAASVSWGAAPDATWESATWEGLGGDPVW
jgi:hypothetical protein